MASCRSSLQPLFLFHAFCSGRVLTRVSFLSLEQAKKENAELQRRLEEATAGHAPAKQVMMECSGTKDP